MRIETILLLIAVIFFSGCRAEDETAPRVVFLLPDNYLGAFKVSESSSGKATKESAKEYVIEIPTNGRVALEDVGILREWHRLSAKYKSGNSIADGDFDSQGGGVRFFSLWTESNGNTFYFVGTLEDFEKAEKAGPWKIEEYLPEMDDG